MKTEITAQQIINSRHDISTIQHLEVRPGVKVDQDGNRYADALTKYTFLRDCLRDGIRSGNLKPITTPNQCSDLIARINAAARECGQPEVSEVEAAKEIAGYAAMESSHSNRVALMPKFRSEFLAAGMVNERAQAEAWKKLDSMTDAEVSANLNA